MALSVAFLTPAVPLALDARWYAATRALEGAALVWNGCRQNRLLPRLFGALLNIAARVIVFTEFDAAHQSLLLGGTARLIAQPAPFPRMRVARWSVLLLAVAVLGWMAYRIAKDPKENRPGGGVDE